ncbi:hypothetical protein [Rothia sp. P7208]|uniref:hypothetical protein n=1 Tax=Rothia sp. P7208 TaxID=3402660 RepID=UPI003AD7714D
MNVATDQNTPQPENTVPPVPVEPVYGAPRLGDVPEEYQVPEQYRRPYGAHPADKRGISYFPAVVSLTSGVFALVLTFMLLGASGLAYIPCIVATIYATIAFKRSKQRPQTAYYRSKSKLYANLGLGFAILSAICTTIFLIVFPELGNLDPDCDNVEPGSVDEIICESYDDSSQDL